MSVYEKLVIQLEKEIDLKKRLGLYFGDLQQKLEQAQENLAKWEEVMEGLCEEMRMERDNDYALVCDEDSVDGY